MKYLSLYEFVDYVNEASIEFPCTMELVIVDDAPVEFEMKSKDDFFDTLCDLAGNIGTLGMLDSKGRVV